MRASKDIAPERRPIGRPRKSADSLRGKAIIVRASVAEHAKLTLVAERAGKQLAVWLRELALQEAGSS